MSLRASTSARAGIGAAMKLARLLELPEAELEKRVRELEGDPVFSRLKEEGVLSVRPFSQARLASRRFAGWGLRTDTEGTPELLDGDGEIVGLIRRLGEERFRECFLGDAALKVAERARRSGLSEAEARRLSDFVGRLYIREELETPSAHAAPSTAMSAVAGIALENGRPVLGFFNREIWKGRYDIDDRKRAELVKHWEPGEARRAERFLRQLEFLDRRKSTLHRVLEAVLKEQAEFLSTGEPEKRRPLPQKEVAADLDVSPSVLNRLISNKSVQLPWGLEAPLKVFFPSRKSLLRDKLHELAVEKPDASDEALRRELAVRFAARLSRRSVAQYRKELRLGGKGRRLA